VPFRGTTPRSPAWPWRRRWGWLWARFRCGAGFLGLVPLWAGFFRGEFLVGLGSSRLGGPGWAGLLAGYSAGGSGDLELRPGDPVTSGSSPVPGRCRIRGDMPPSPGLGPLWNATGGWGEVIGAGVALGAASSWGRAERQAAGRGSGASDEAGSCRGSVREVPREPGNFSMVRHSCDITSRLIRAGPEWEGSGFDAGDESNP